MENFYQTVLLASVFIVFYLIVFLRFSYSKQIKIILLTSYKTLKIITGINLAFAFIYLLIFMIDVSSSIDSLNSNNTKVTSELISSNMKLYKDVDMNEYKEGYFYLLDIFIFSTYMFLSASYKFSLTENYLQIIPAFQGILGLISPAIFITILLEGFNNKRRGYDALSIRLNQGWEITDIGKDYDDTYSVFIEKDNKKKLIYVDKTEESRELINEFVNFNKKII